ncbi:hypothetical protein [Risungbinella massiliensis]|uniref:hypothetical protein n=1 Tax=Risungbinella massiliensis TaxID=1329796 RepID=UPI0005CC57AF|nr:hypothetical protein [Risungbinella massiliensis]
MEQNSKHANTTRVKDLSSLASCYDEKKGSWKVGDLKQMSLELFKPTNYANIAKLESALYQLGIEEKAKTSILEFWEKSYTQHIKEYEIEQTKRRDSDNKQLSVENLHYTKRNQKQALYAIGISASSPVIFQILLAYFKGQIDITTSALLIAGLVSGSVVGLIVIRNRAKDVEVEDKK